MAEQNGYHLRTVKAAIDVNRDQKTLLYKMASQRLITFQGLKVAVLGLAFKPGTDDLREAPSLENIPIFVEQHADIYAFDPAAKEKFQKQFLDGIVYADSPEEALDGANVCFIFTEWDEIKNIEPKQYRRFMRMPLVYYGRNIYNPDEMEQAGVEYYSIGR